MATKASVILSEALGVFALFSDVWWHPQVIMLKALRSFILEVNLVREPLIMALDQQKDRVAVRHMITLSYNVDNIHVVGGTQTLIQLFTCPEMLVLDLTGVHIGTVNYVKPLLNARSIPGSKIGARQDDQSSSSIQGETGLIISETALSAIEDVGLVLYLKSTGPSLLDLGAMSKSLEGLKEVLTTLAESCRPDINDSDLPYNRLISPVRRRSCLVLAAQARLLDQILPEGHFFDAVKAAWEEEGLRASQSTSQSRKDAILAGHLLCYAEKEPFDDPRDGYFHDKIVSRISSEDKQLFSKLNEVCLGNFFRWKKIGIVNPFKRFITYEPDEKGVLRRVWHSVVFFSAADKAKLRALSAGEEGNFMPPEEGPLDTNKEWLLSTFLGRKSVAPSDIKFKLKGVSPHLSLEVIFTMLEDLVKAGTISKSGDSSYDFSSVVKKPKGKEV